MASGPPTTSEPTTPPRNDNHMDAVDAPYRRAPTAVNQLSAVSAITVKTQRPTKKATPTAPLKLVTNA